MIALLARVTGSFGATFVTAWVAIALACVAWAIATPLGATPDEPSHVIKAASVARGELIGSPGSDPSRTIVEVPAGIAQAWNWTCHARDLTISAACIPPSENGLDLVEAETSAGLYNPVYYAIVGWPSLVITDTGSAVLAMRTVSALLVSGLLAFAFALIMRMTPRVIGGIAFAAATTPMVFYLGGALSPNGLEIAASLAVATGLLYICLGNAGHRIPVLIGVAVSGLLLANARGISPLWLAAIGTIVLVVTPRERLAPIVRTTAVRVTLVVLGIGVVAAIAWVLATGSLGALGTFAGAGTVSPVEAFLVMLTRVADPGVIGIFGWGETVAPGVVFLVWSTLLAGVLVAAFSVARGRALIGIVVGVGAIVLLPAIVQAASIRTSGYIWQGRYTLALIAAVVVIAAVLVAPRLAELPGAVLTRVSLVAAAAVVVGHVAAFAYALLRYASPGSTSPGAFLGRGEWSPPGTGLLWLAALGLGLVLLSALWLGRRPVAEAGPVEPEPVEG